MQSLEGEAAIFIYRLRVSSVDPMGTGLLRLRHQHQHPHEAALHRSRHLVVDAPFQEHAPLQRQFGCEPAMLGGLRNFQNLAEPTRTVSSEVGHLRLPYSLWRSSRVDG